MSEIVESKMFDDYEINTNTKEIPVFNVINILGRDFTIYGCDRNPLFLARDVAEVIDYCRDGKGNRNVNMMLRTVPENEKLTSTILVSGPKGSQRRKMWFVTENGLYTILMQSRKPLALQFQEEVKKILWTLRREGIYASPNTISFYMNEPEELEHLVEDFKRIEDERNYYRDQLNEIKEDAQYARDVLTYSGRTYTMRDICEQCHIKISYKDMYEKLRENKLMYRVGDKNYFTFPAGREKFCVTVSYVKVTKDGRKITVNKKRWTEAGKQWVYSYALSWGLVDNDTTHP